MQDIRIDRGCQNHDQDDAEEDPEAAEETGQHDHNAANGPEPAGEPVGLVPVFLVVQCPGDLDAHGVVLLALGQVIAHDGQHKTHKNGHDHLHPDRLTQSRQIGEGAQKNAHNGNDPKYQLQDLVRVIFLLGVGGSTQNAQPLDRQQQTRQAEYRKGLAAPAVNFTGSIPVGGDLLRQLIPQDQTDGDGHKDQNGCDE